MSLEKKRGEYLLHNYHKRYVLLYPVCNIWHHLMALNMPANLENSIVVTGLETVSFHSNTKEGNGKECSNYRTIVLISHASKVMLKILQARLQQYVNHELPLVPAGFRKCRGTRNQIANIHWIIKKSKRVPEKHPFLLHWLCQSLWLCGSQ